MQIASEAPEQFENALNRLMETRSPREVVHELTSGRILLQRASEDLLTPEEREAILVPTSRLRDRTWTVDDLPLLDEAAVQLDGTPALGKRYLHIVVDEAQDLSPMQLRMLRRRLSRNGAMTVLGDLAQGMSPWAPSRWEDHLGSADIEVDEVVQLRHSYRTTAPLLDYANRLLASIDVEIEPAASVLVDGDDPAVLRCVDAKELDQSLIEFVETVLPEEADSGSVAVIADDDTLGRVSEAFDDAGIRHTWAARSLDMPVTLVPATSANGLEFDHVFVLEPEALYRTDAVMGPRLLYVALTRARETVTLLHHKRLPPVLTGPPTMPAPLAAPGEPAEAAPTQPPAAADGTPTIQPTPADPGWSWFLPTANGQDALHVLVAGTTAQIERMPTGGGAGIPVASGYALADDDSLYWLLRRTDGSVFTLTTDRAPGPASEAVVAAARRPARGTPGRP